MLDRSVLKAADLFRVEGLLEHCVEAFGRGLKVKTPKSVCCLLRIETAVVVYYKARANLLNGVSR